MSITPADVKRVVESTDDFGHEMRVGSVLEKVRSTMISIGLLRFVQAKHGHSYVDPITGKPRQFDYQFRITKLDGTRTIYLAIECKNIPTNTPAIICGRPRMPDESKHSYFEREPNAIVERHLEGAKSYYQPGKFVGKSVMRIKEVQKKFVPDNDAEIYDRWAQALAQGHVLAREAASIDHPGHKSFAIPIVVLPNDTLWMAKYNRDGKLAEQPCQVTSCEFFLGHQVKLGTFLSYGISHIHFMTLDGLNDFLKAIAVTSDSAWDTIFND